MKKKVYIETTIPSFYYEMRTEPEMVARREWTVEWWDNHKENYLVVSSEAVLDELNNGDYQKKQEVLNLIAEVPLLPIEQAIIEIVESYIQHKLMPSDPLGDALHLALASYHKCDFLLTWNCNHLANANKFHHIKRINTLLGLYIPTLITPLELLGETYAER
ncbi:MAG: type II toxin-antitoxin system VapC family toxin [Bacteroidota bacterium]